MATEYAYKRVFAPGSIGAHDWPDGRVYLLEFGHKHNIKYALRKVDSYNAERNGSTYVLVSREVSDWADILDESFED